MPAASEPAIDPKIMRIARAVTRDLAAHGAIAVVMTGSHARGDAHASSDLDLVTIVAKKPRDEDRRAWLRPYRVRNGVLVSTPWETPTGVRAAFRDRRLAPTFVPGWREAIILHDPTGIAAKLKRAAERWTWDVIAADCDRHAAEGITGLAEEVHKLVGMLRSGNKHAAAAQRSILAVWLAGHIAEHRRILFATDNVLWDLVAESMGEPWASAQARAFSEHGESLEDSCRAALELYRLAAADVRPLLGRHQREVVDAACDLTPGPFPEGKGSWLDNF
jgi:hypothetical protein